MPLLVIPIAAVLRAFHIPHSERTLQESKLFMLLDQWLFQNYITVHNLVPDPLPKP